MSRPNLIRHFVKVTKGIPIPPNARHEYKWPWLDMTEVGDSFLCPFGGVDPEVVLRRMQSQAGCAGIKFKPQEFRARRAKGGIRVWRTK